MATDKLNRLQSLIQNVDLEDTAVMETSIKETPVEQASVEEAPVNWYTGNTVRESALHEDYCSGASGSSDWDYAVRRLAPESQKKKKRVRKSRRLADMVDQDEMKRSLGDLSPAGMGFVPLLALAKYPYKFLSATPTVVDRVSKGFFAAEKFWSRKWTVFFAYPPGSISPKPIHFVPSSEVKALLKEINEGFTLDLGFPANAEQRGFYLEFPNDGQPRPLFLGISSSKEAFNIMERQTPSASDLMVKGTETLASLNDDRSFSAFAARMEGALLATKAKSKASKEQRKLQRVQQKDALCRQLRRSQRFLGIRPKSDRNMWSMPEPPRMDVPGQTWEEYVRLKEQFDEIHQQKLPPLNYKSPVPYPFEQEVVFISFDVEAYEKSHKTITEVGISSLDTLHLNGVAPGPGGANWIDKIRSRHFRIKEHKHLVNKDFIVGCPDRFEKDFGESEFISIKDAPQVVASCFRAPFAARTSELTAIQEASEDEKHVKRNIILVGHNAKQDVDYLREMGYDLSNLSNVVEVLDTADLYRALAHEENPVSLGTLLYNVGLSGWNLHNAGNDAAYTLQALIGIAFRGLASNTERKAKSLAERVGDAAKEAAERVADDNEEWSVADGTDDGGVPVYNLPKAKEPSSSLGRGGNRGASGSRGRGNRGTGGYSRGARSDRSGIHVQEIPAGPPPPYSRQNPSYGSNAYTGQDNFGGFSRQQGTLDDGRGGYGDWEEEPIEVRRGGAQTGRGSYGPGSRRQQGYGDDGRGGYGDWEEGHVSPGSGGGVQLGRGSYGYGEGSPRQQGGNNRAARGQMGGLPAPIPEEPQWGPRGHDNTWW